MNRINKYRGQRLDKSEWLIGDLNHIDGKVFIFPRTEDTPPNSPDWFEVIPETVGQYWVPGMDGNDIYEGDVVMLGNGHATFLVVFYKGSLRLLPRWNKGMLKPLQTVSYYIQDNLTTIGNIFDSPNLLKGETAI